MTHKTDAKKIFTVQKCRKAFYSLKNLYSLNLDKHIYNFCFQLNPLGDCFYAGSCYYLNCSNWGGPKELTVPIYGFLMPVIIVSDFIPQGITIVTQTLSTLTFEYQPLQLKGCFKKLLGNQEQMLAILLFLPFLQSEHQVQTCKDMSMQ